MIVVCKRKCTPLAHLHLPVKNQPERAALFIFDPVVSGQTPPTWINQSGPNFQGVIRTWEKMNIYEIYLWNQPDCSRDQKRVSRLKLLFHSFQRIHTSFHSVFHAVLGEQDMPFKSRITRLNSGTGKLLGHGKGLIILEYSSLPYQILTFLLSRQQQGSDLIELRLTWGKWRVDFLVIFQGFWIIFEGFLGLP